MKKFLLFFIGILFSGLAFADGINVKVVDRLVDATGTDTYIYCKADGKIYAYNTKGEYELYGEYSKVNTLQTAGADQQIEYIETTTDMENIPYINTGYIHNPNTRIEMECNITDNTLKNYEALFGARSWTTGEAMVFFWRFGGNNNGCYAVNSREERGDEMYIMPTDEDIKVVAEGNLLDVYTMDDLDTPYLTIQNEQDQIDGQREMYLFDLNNNNNRDNSTSFMKLYSCKIYEGDQLIMDLVPVVTGDGRSGLKDLVSGRKFFSPNNVNFAVSPDGEEALSGAGITAYEGKLVCLTTNNHEYKYTNGEWVDCGPMALEPIEDEEYKDMSTWICPDDKYPCFYWFYDEFDDYNSLNYTGGGMWEPLVKEIKVTPGETYNFSFDYESDDWGSWTNHYMNSCITSSVPNPLTNGNYQVNGPDNMNGDDVRYGTIAWHVLPRTGNVGEPITISYDFTPTQDHQYLVFNFGLVEDGRSLQFIFTHLQVSKYNYAEKYSYAPQLAAQVALAQDFMANNTTTTALKNQMNAEISKAQGLIASGTSEEQYVEYNELVKLLDKLKANNFSGDVWTKTMALAKKERANVAEFEDYIVNGTESTYDEQLNRLREQRKANLLEKSDYEFTENDAESPAPGDFYLYNVGTKAFLVGGSHWGAHAAIGWPGIKITLEAPEEGDGYYINTHMWHCSWDNSEYGINGGTENQWQGYFLGGSAYLDTGRYPWKFMPVEGKANVFNIVKEITTDEGVRYECLGYNPYARTDAGYYPFFNTVGAYETDLSAENNQWMLITEDTRTALVDQATAKNPADLSYLIKMPNFSQREYSDEDNPNLDVDENGVVKGWRGVWNCNNGGNITDRNRGDRDLRNISGDLAYDAYEHSAGDMIYQEVEVPADGYYGISINAVCRPGRLNELVEQLQQGDTPLVEAILFVDQVEKELPLFSECADMAPGYGEKTAIGEVPTTHVQAINCFQNGLYKMELIADQPLYAGDKLKFGLAQNVDGIGTSYWVMADNFRLKYYGEVDPATGVEKVETDKVEGINDGKYYTLQGYAVDRPTKRGIYIRNGKKIVVK